MASPMVATAGLLLETSVGSLTVDMLGADCPALSANFLNLCRAQFWNGAVVTEVIPEVAVFFSLTADPTYHSRLCAALDIHGAQDTMQSFLALLPLPAATGTQPDAVAQQQRALQTAMQQEARLCKRRRCTGLSSQPTGAGAVCRPVFAAAATTAATGGAGPVSPCSVSQAGCLLVDGAAPTLRFGLTLSNRAMEFLDRQYVTIGHVVDGAAVLRRLQRLPFRDRPAGAASPVRRVASREDVVGGRPASAWPQPLRMLRLKRALVLPTAGTDRYLVSPASPSASTSLSVLSGTTSAAEAQRRRQRVGELLHQAGCFEWWASAAAVRVAQGRLVDVVAASLAASGYAGPPGRPRSVAEATALTSTPAGGTGAAAAAALAPLIITRNVPAASSASADVAVEVAYNPHATGAFLSSDDDDDDGDGRGYVSGGGVAAQSARQLEERRRTFMQQHQEKANETLSLMLNVLNGVADTRGDIKPPENVLFVCKLNPVTTGDGLALCFAQFGRVVSADVVVDARTKQSLCYGFVEFETVEACFRAFQKMDRALVDDCRIHVDFSQSVSKLWAQRQREMRKRDRPIG